MQEINYLEGAALVSDKMSHGGVFLTVPGDNTMNIGWGLIGPIWNMPVFTVAVRPSRYTYALLDEGGRFTVSVPLEGNLKKELALAGTLSGRDGDKFARCHVTREKGQFIDCPIVKECQLHFECEVVHRQDLTPEMMDEHILQDDYPKGDLHRLFFGKILGCYRTDK